MALVGTGGIGKTSIILTVLDDYRIKQRFGHNRSFIRCDRLTASHTHFLRRLSEATGAGVENPEDLSTMRQYLSSREMVIVLDNAESILGLAEVDAREIYSIVDELSRFNNICLVITSRIPNTLPSHCEIIETPTLSMEAGQETFYRIYRFGERSDEINDMLKELDFHPLSITLLATVSQQNRWNAKRLTTEWEKQRIGVLRTRNLGSLAAMVELSLASPMFQELGPDARELLGAVAFFPQGVHEDNVEGLFPMIPDGPSVFDTFCNLSLTNRGHGFVTMLAPLRDYLQPKDPTASPLLCTAKDHYFRRLSIDLRPGEPGFEESRWIVSEDVNVEHLLDVFMSIDADSEDVWDACDKFMDHLRYHKPRLVILGSKVEGLPDSHPSKPFCLASLSLLLGRVGNDVESKRILIQNLEHFRESGNDYGVAVTLINLSDANRWLGFREEGIRQAREALDIFGRLGEAPDEARCLLILALLLCRDGQLDTAKEAAICAMDLMENRDQYRLCVCHGVLGQIQQSKGNTKEAIHHFEASLRLASSINSRVELAETHLGLAGLYTGQDKLNEAQTHIEHVKSLAQDDMFTLGRAFHHGARVLFGRKRFEEAKSEALRALVMFEKLGATENGEMTRELLEEIGERI